MDIEIPISLRELNGNSSEVNIIVGENGQGKSQVLSELADDYWRSGKSVIAVATSVHDKFTYRNDKRYSLMRARARRSLPSKVIKDALLNISSSKEVDLRRINRALRYVGYDGVIGIELGEFSPSMLYQTDADIDSKLADIVSDFERYYSKERAGPENVVWIDMEGYSLESLKEGEMLNIIPYEKELKKIKVTSGIEIFLRKNNRTIPLLKASSGELSLITLIIYLVTRIDDNTAIVIDEPENSLHPQWQKEYTKTLLDIFSYYQPKLIMATHSPIVVSGAEASMPSSSEVSVFTASNGRLVKSSEGDMSIEDILLDMFGVVTPKSHSLSDRVVGLLNSLAEGKQNLNSVTVELEKLKDTVYDPRQTDLIDRVRGMAQEIAENV